MMSAETIRELQDDMAQRAREKGLEPTYDTPFPGLGTYRPDGWQLVREFFVDSSGFGTDHDPALTIDEFLDARREGMGYAVTSAGQFQVYVGEFMPTVPGEPREADPIEDVSTWCVRRGVDL